MEELDGFRDDDEEEEEEGLGFFLGGIGFRLGLFFASLFSFVGLCNSTERESVCFTVLFMRFYCFFVVWDWDFPPKYYSKFPK